ncbi:MAG: ATP-grasp fold amidoligase family protein [bacterium]
MDFGDFVFSKIAGPWTDFQRNCVDKEKAKKIAKSICFEVKTARTLALFPLSKRSTLKELKVFLRPYLGKKTVAKAIHASGGVVLLDRVQPGQVEALFKIARRDYFLNFGESQYRGLPRKILIEESLASLGQAPPTDYRFFCSRGKAWFGSADMGRFTDLRKFHFTVPNFSPVYIQTHGRFPDKLPARPSRFRQMVRIAEKLSKPFDFARIDLYQTPRGVYFGEFTFTPMAGIFRLSNPELSRWLARKALNPQSGSAFPEKWKGPPPR